MDGLCPHIVAGLDVKLDFSVQLACCEKYNDEMEF